MKEHERVLSSLNLGSEWIIKGLSEIVKNCFELKYRGELKCPSCGAEAKKYGFEPSRRYWKHIGGLSVSARRPRVKCPNCGVRVINASFARPDSRFTLAFEIYAKLLCVHMPIARVSRILGIDEKTVKSFKRYWELVDLRKERANEDNSNTVKILLSNLLIYLNVDYHRVAVMNFNSLDDKDYKSPEEFLKVYRKALEAVKNEEKGARFFILPISQNDINAVQGYKSMMFMRMLNKLF